MQMPPISANEGQILCDTPTLQTLGTFDSSGEPALSENANAV